jgi:hypothetical protein
VTHIQYFSPLARVLMFGWVLLPGLKADFIEQTASATVEHSSSLQNSDSLAAILTISPFDADLGTLDAVSIQLQAHLFSYWHYRVFRSSGVSYSGLYRINVDSALAGLLSQSASTGDISATQADGAACPAPICGMTSYSPFLQGSSTVADPGSFVGSNPLQFQASADVAFASNTFSGFLWPQLNGVSDGVTWNLTAIYDYTPVPEPRYTSILLCGFVAWLWLKSRGRMYSR